MGSHGAANRVVFKVAERSPETIYNPNSASFSYAKVEAAVENVEADVGFSHRRPE